MRLTVPGPSLPRKGDVTVALTSALSGSLPSRVTARSSAGRSFAGSQAYDYDEAVDGVSSVPSDLSDDARSVASSNDPVFGKDPLEETVKFQGLAPTRSQLGTEYLGGGAIMMRT